jgi:hypothetical protein
MEIHTFFSRSPEGSTDLCIAKKKMLIMYARDLIPQPDQSVDG